MKHITSFTATLLLWLCCALTAWADGITVASTYTPINDVTDGFYLLKSRIKGTNGYIYRKSGDAARPLRQKPEASMDLTNIDLTYVWYVTKNADGILILQNASTGEYIPAYNGNGGDMKTLSTTTSNAALLKAKEFTPYTNSLDGGVLLYQANYGQFIHANTSGEHNLSYWSGGTAGDASSVGQFALYKLDGTISEEHITKTYAATINFKKEDGTTVKTIYSPTLVNGTVTATAPSLSSFYSIGSDQTLSFTYTTENPTHDVTVTKSSSLPFTLSTPENPVWYKITARNQNNSGAGNYAVWINDSQIQTGSGSGNSHYGANYQTTYKALKGAYWAFVEDGFGVKLYNYASKKYVTVGGTDANATMNTSGTTFYAQTTTATGATFSLQYSGNSYLGDHRSSYLGSWTNSSAQNNEGSGWKAIAIDESDLTLARNIASNTLPKCISGQTNTDNALTMNTTEAAEKGKTALAKLTESPSWSNLDEVFDGLEGVNLSATPDLTAYYRIRNVNSDLTNRYLSSENIVVGTDGSLNTAYTASTGMDRKVTRTSDKANFGSQLWRFTKNNDGTYTLRNANTDREMGEAGTNIEMPINIGYGNGHYTFKPYTNDIEGYDANSMFVMYDVASNQVGANSSDDYVSRNNDHYTDKSNYWQILKVTEVPVTIKNVGWASVSYPFAVKVPTESGVKAYIAETAAGNVLTLKEIEDGIIPANTGVLLAKAGGCTVNLPLTTTTASYASVNKLVGTAAERTGYTTETTYVLSAKGGSVGLLPSTLTFVPSNKAFLPKANITTESAGAQMLNFYVNGSITGISQTLTTDQEATQTYYDLNGRRVLYPTHGIYVTGNGKKVFIK